MQPRSSAEARLDRFDANRDGRPAYTPTYDVHAGLSGESPRYSPTTLSVTAAVLSFTAHAHVSEIFEAILEECSQYDRFPNDVHAFV